MRSSAGPAALSVPGYAVVGETMAGAEPAPVGVSKMRNHGAKDPRMAAMGGQPGSGPLDPSVVPTNLPPAQAAIASPPSNRPHIISHLFGCRSSARSAVIAKTKNATEARLDRLRPARQTGR